MSPSSKSLILLTGLSGAGKSTALRILEDKGFYCIDNLPFSLLDPYLKKEFKKKQVGGRLAIDMDVRDKDFFRLCENSLPLLKKRYPFLKTLFLTASEETLLQRFSHTRRRHPLSGHGNLSKAIRKELKMAEKIRRLADTVIDTSPLTVHTLKMTLENLIEAPRKLSQLPISLLSFGYRYGIPPQSDLVLDVRFLPNPYFVPSLKPLDGTERKVQNFVIQRRLTREFIKKTKDLLDFLIPHYSREGKSYLTVAFGCTGGRHRSVVLASYFKDYFTRKGLWVSLEHRDRDKKT